MNLVVSITFRVARCTERLLSFADALIRAKSSSPTARQHGVLRSIVVKRVDVIRPIWRPLLFGLGFLCGPTCAQSGSDAGSLEQAAVTVTKGYRYAGSNERACVLERQLRDGIVALQGVEGRYEQKAEVAPKVADEPMSTGEIYPLSPRVADLPWSSAARERSIDLPRKYGYIGGTSATGLIVGVHLKIGSGVFLSFDLVPKTQRKSTERWVEVEFPESLANGAGSAIAFISDSESSIGVGDVVEIKIAHTGSKEAMRYFPVLGITRVTKLVAKHHDVLAQHYLQCIRERHAGSKIAATGGAHSQ